MTQVQLRAKSIRELQKGIMHPSYLKLKRKEQELVQDTLRNLIQLQLKEQAQEVF